MFSFVSAQCDNPGIPPQIVNTTFDLIQVCDTCTFVNISSVTFPNGSFIVYEQEMTKTGKTYNFTFNDSSQLGTYNYFVYGDKGGGSEGEPLCFEITPTGGDLDLPQSIVIVGLFLILLFLSIVFLVWGNKIDYLPFKIFVTSLGGLFMMFNIGVATNVVIQLLTVGAVLSGTFSSLYTLMLILTSAWGIGLIVYIIYMSVRQFYSHRGLIDESDDD